MTEKMVKRVFRKGNMVFAIRGNDGEVVARKKPRAGDAVMVSEADSVLMNQCFDPLPGTEAAKVDSPAAETAQDDIERLTTALSDSCELVSELEDRLNVGDDQIGSIEGQLSDAKTEIGRLASQSASKDNEVEILKTAAIDSTDAIKNLTAENAGLKKKKGK